MRPVALSQPLIPAVLAYCAGLSAAHFFSGAVPLKTAAAAAVLLACCAAAALLRRYRTTAAVCLLFLLILAGYCRLHPLLNPDPAQNSLLRHADAGNITLEAVVSEPAVQTLNRTRLKLSSRFLHSRDSRLSVTGNLLLSIKESSGRFGYGDRILFTASLRRPQNFSNPGGFDYIRYLAYKNIYATAFLESDLAVTKIGSGEGNILLLRTELMRSKIRACIRGNLRPPASDILLALIIGEKGTIDEEVRSRFSALGITHILCISGLHVSIVALLSYFLIFNALKLYPRLLLHMPAKKIAAVLSIVPVLGYCLIAGMATPAARSGLMVACYLLTLLLDRPQHMLHTLFVAACAILAVSPQSLFEISFQLSFLAVFCLIVLLPAWKTAYPKKEPDPFLQASPLRAKITSYTLDSLLSSAAAILGTAPLVAWYFHIFAPSGFIANLLMVPLAGFVLVPLGLASALLVFIGEPLAAALFKINGFCTDVFLYLSRVLYSVLGDGIAMAKPLLWEIAAFYGLLFFSALCRTKKHWAACAGAALVLLCAEALHAVYLRSPDTVLSVTFLDVGAGDAAVIRLPDKQVMVVDGGGLRDDSFDTGKAVVAPFLYDCGIKKIDYMVMTHPHRDHAGGLPYLAKTFTLREFWNNGSRLPLDCYQALQNTAAQQGARVIACSRASAKRRLGAVEFEFFNPRSTGTDDPENTNNDSLVLKLSYGKISFLFTGDILKEAEADLAAAGADLGATVLKVPHHGGQSSCTQALLDAVQPQVAVISGRSQRKRQSPHPAVRARLSERKITSLTTQDSGAITIETDGRDFKIKTYKAAAKL